MVDVTVMGAGVFGLAVAFGCARRGARVRVVEARAPGAGASGGVVGALAPHAPEAWSPIKAFQLEALVQAPGWWAAVAGTGGRDPGYGRVGRIQPLADAAAVARAQARAAGAEALWGGAGRWELCAAEALPGLKVHSPTGQVVHDTLSARLHPRAACAALVAALEALGVRVEAGDTPPGDGAPVVWATGWAGLARAGLGGAVKGQGLVLAQDAAGAAMVCDTGLFVVPHADGRVAVGSTSERTFGDATATDGQLDAVLARAVALCPDLAGATVIERWAGLRPRAGRGQPVLGRWGPGQYIANGGFKIGFALAPLVGERMADLVLEGRAEIPGAFAPPDPG
ncbi:MAG: NAD(P)/FAD-dependent oxidoreductase [Alkalilacustris sp.]